MTHELPTQGSTTKRYYTPLIRDFVWPKLRVTKFNFENWDTRNIDTARNC